MQQLSKNPKTIFWCLIAFFLIFIKNFRKNKIAMSLSILEIIDSERCGYLNA